MDLVTNTSNFIFEAAVDALVNGNQPELERLILETPELVQMRSERVHRSTLLHYVSANGVEDSRQKTPPNIVEVARLLLQSGADVHAESEAYGGRSTALGLTATSLHPESAGVQIPLLELLIEYGARADGVNACLANGRGRAAEFLANRGARLDLEGAAGVGRLDIARGFFDKDGKLLAPATPKQLNDGFGWACEYGRIEMVDFLLQNGADVNAADGLHWSALGGHSGILKLLLAHGAAVALKDNRYGATPLGWAMHAWRNSSERAKYSDVASILVHAGAAVDPEWFEFLDAPMSAALRGQ